MAAPMTAAQERAQMKKWLGPRFKEYSGWTTRKRPGSFAPVGIVIHHTGSDSGQNSANYDHFLFVEGRPAEGIPGPLCHATCEMDGDVIVGAIGRANHAGSGSSRTLAAVKADNVSLSAQIRPGADDTNGNGWFYGLEVKFDGGQPMTSKQYDSAVRYAAAICDFYGWSAGSIVGHKEWSSRKPDPGSTDMAKFRRDVAARLKAGPGFEGVPVPPPIKDKPEPEKPVVQEEYDMFITRYGASLYRMFIDRRVIPLSEGTYNILKDGGIPVKQLSNAAVDALESICENYLKVDATPTAGTEDAFVQAEAARLAELNTAVTAIVNMQKTQGEALDAVKSVLEGLASQAGSGDDAPKA